MLLKVFGKNPSGNELEKIKASTNYRYESFNNLVPTSMMETAARCR